MRSLLCLSIVAASGLAGCGSLDPSERLLGAVTPYRVEIVQGNVVTRELMSEVKTGQTRDHVRDLLGSPMLADVFHGDRWDYVFTIRRQGAEPQRRHVVLHFKGDVLDRIESAGLPSEREFVASIDARGLKFSPRSLELSEEQRKALPIPPKPGGAEAAAAPAGAARSYPPLEPAP